MSQQAMVRFPVRGNKGAGAGGDYGRPAAGRGAARSLEPERPFQLYRDGELARPSGASAESLTPDEDAPGMARLLRRFDSRRRQLDTRVENLFAGYQGALHILSSQLLGEAEGNGSVAARVAASVWEDIVKELRKPFPLPVRLIFAALDEITVPEELTELEAGVGFTIAVQRLLTTSLMAYREVSSNPEILDEFLALEGLPTEEGASHQKGQVLAHLDDLIGVFEDLGLSSCEDYETRLAAAFVTDPGGEGSGRTFASLLDLGQVNGRIRLDIDVEVRAEAAGWDFTTGSPRAALFTAERTEAATRWLNDLLAREEGPSRILDLLAAGIPVEVVLTLAGDTDDLNEHYYAVFTSLEGLAAYRGETLRGNPGHPALRAFWSGASEQLFHGNRLEVGE